MFALCDCNNFYVSCERLFRPDLQNRPVVVLSNNDGCIVARSNEVKALGIKMGEPLFKVQDLVKKHGIVTFSSNYELYADMSNRVMSLLSEHAAESEIYSIDEIFLSWFGMEHYNLKDYATELVTKTERSTGIPICIGIGSTKTLAKLANRFAKKYPAYKRVCLIDTPEKQEKALKLTEVGDIWGIGRKYAEKLNKNGIATAYDFTQMSKNWVRKLMSVVGERIWKELQGESCLPLETIQPDKKQICTSRSFGQPVTEFSDLFSAVASFAEKNAYKLRKQKSFAASLMVFVATNYFNKTQPQYYNSKLISLPVPTASTTELVHFSRLALEKIFLPGYFYKKAGVIITEITSTAVQGNLFHDYDAEKHNRLMRAIDTINDNSDRQMITIAAAGTGKADMKRNILSPRYSTRIEDIITVKP